MSSRLRLGIIGCGFIGRIHLGNAVSLPEIDLRVVCDADPEAARAAAEAGEAQVWAQETIELCRADVVDALVIATHPAVRTELALEAIAHGKHVLLEKPVAPSVEEIRAIATAADKMGVVAAVNLKFRAAPALVALRQAITVPRFVSLNVAMPRMANDSPHMDPAVGGGLMPNLGTHVADLASWLMRSPVREVSCRAAYFDDRSPATPDLVSGQLLHENQQLSSFCIADLGVAAYTSKWLVQAGDGNTAGVVTGHGTRLYVGDNPEPIVTDPVSPHEVGTRAVLEAFAQAALGTGPAVADVADGLAAAEVVTAADRSAAHGGVRVSVGYG